jgi:hypothetical protein
MQAYPWWSIPYREKPPFVVATALLLPMCCVFLLRAFQGKERLWWAGIGILAIGLSVVSNYLANTKNGMAILVICIFSFALYGAVHLIAGWAKKSFIKTLVSLSLAASLLIGVAWGVKLHLEKNPAWSQLIANAKVGIDIDHQQYWKNRNVYTTHPINETLTNSGKDIKSFLEELTQYSGFKEFVIPILYPYRYNYNDHLNQFPTAKEGSIHGISAPNRLVSHIPYRPMAKWYF